MNYLVVVAHPDDETLGAGATIHKLVESGNRVAVAIMSSKAAARRGLSASLSDEESIAMRILGVVQVYHADFPNIRMNTVPHLELVQFIEKCMIDWQASAIITHHPSDTNIDHYETSKAVNAACRLFQRTENVPRLRELLYMEIPSSTEWSLNTSDNRFLPNRFFEIGNEGLELKIQALQVYKGVMRPYPHPRSVEAIKGLAAYRGSQAGLNYAEAFDCVFMTE